MKRISFIMIACIGFLYMLSGCKNSGAEMISTTEFFFDTIITISIENENSSSSAFLNQCFTMCKQIEDTFSRTKEGSELYNINHRKDNTVTVSDEMAYLISEGLKYYEVSDGVFDITIAPVLELWDFKSDDAVVPDEKSLAAAVAKVGASKIHLKGNQLTFDDSDTQIDFGALAKGYTADRLKEYLKRQNVTSGIINLGGNVLTIGKKPNGDLWNVGVQKPFDARNSVITTIPVDGKSVVSAGIYERYFEQDGFRYHHIIDPTTGYPVQNNLWQVTIISDESLVGDALSTICILLGYDQADKLINTLEGVDAKFVLDDGRLRE